MDNMRSFVSMVEEWRVWDNCSPQGLSRDGFLNCWIWCLKFLLLQHSVIFKNLKCKILPFLDRLPFFFPLCLCSVGLSYEHKTLKGKDSIFFSMIPLNTSYNVVRKVGNQETVYFLKPESIFICNCQVFWVCAIWEMVWFLRSLWYRSTKQQGQTK